MVSHFLAGRGSSEIALRILLFSGLGIAFSVAFGAVGLPAGFGPDWPSLQGSAQAEDDDDDDGDHVGDYDVTDADIPSTAGIFYVRISGDDGNSGTSPGDAFRTIRAAALYAPAGSIIYVGAGVYTDNSKLLDSDAPSGTPTRFVADTTGFRTGDSGDVVIGPGGSMSILSCENVRISGFTFQGPTGRCFLWRQSTGGEITDCTFIAGTGAVKIRSGDVAFTDCVIRDFAGVGIEVFGTAELLLLDCEVNTCGSSGMAINETASITINGSTFDGNAENGLTINAITSTDDGPIETSPNQILIAARDLLNTTYGLATSKGNGKIEKAVEKLDEALDPKYWKDGWHPHSKETKEAAEALGLDADEGKKIFENDKKAMNELKDFSDPDKDAELGNYGIVKANITQVNAMILFVNKKLAMTALEEAIIGNGDPDKIEDAYKKLKKVQKEMDKGHPHHAAGKYKDVWKKAVEAGGTAQGTLGIGTDNDNPPDAFDNRHLTISGSNFTNNGYGIRFVTPQTLDMRASDISNNTHWGLYLIGSGRFEDCTIDENGTGGIWLKDLDDADLDVLRNTLADNGTYGLFAESCDLSFTALNIGEWTVTGGDYLFAGTDSTLAFSGVTISGGTTAALLAYQGALTADDTTFSGSGYGLAVDQCDVTLTNCTLTGNTVGLYATQNDSLSVNSSTFTSNTQWGAVVYPKTPGGASVTFDACTFHSNTGGLSVVSAVDGQVSLRANTMLRDNTSTGLHFDACDLNVNDQAGGANWRTLRNHHGISSNNSTLTLSNINIEDSGQYGVYCEGSDISLVNCTITGSGGINASTTNNSLNVDASRFDSTTTTGWGILRSGGTVDVRNSVFNGYWGGVFLSTADAAAATLRNITIANALGYGVYVASGDTTVQNTIVAGNGSTFSGMYNGMGALTHSHNLVHGFTTPFFGTTANSTEIQKAPRFVDAAGGNVQLSKGSPAINAGIDLGTDVPTDMVGNARPAHGVFEIGAYEFTSGNGSYRVLNWQERK